MTSNVTISETLQCFKYSQNSQEVESHGKCGDGVAPRLLTSDAADLPTRRIYARKLLRSHIEKLVEDRAAQDSRKNDRIMKM
jgi:hypothetical protein